MFQIGDRRWLNADFPEVTSQLSIIGLSWADAAEILQTIETARLVQRSAHVFQERARRTGMDLTKNRERLFQAFRRVVLLGKVFAKHFAAFLCLETPLLGWRHGKRGKTCIHPEFSSGYQRGLLQLRGEEVLLSDELLEKISVELK